MQDASVSLADWLLRLESVSPSEIELGLDRVGAVYERLDLELPRHVLTIAGTNGKGSSVAMLAGLLAGAGYRVGAYTSPHLQRYNERIVVVGQAAGDAAIVAAFQRIDEARGDIRLTYFEFGTLAAMIVFAEHKLDAVVLEVGLGGRLDAVNAIEPDAGLITSIALDHQEWLGDTREAIGAEKAGILRAGKPLVYAEPDRPQSVDAAAAESGAALYAAGRDFAWHAGDEGRWSYSGVRHRIEGLLRPSLPGEFQLDNAAGVLCLLEVSGFEALLDARAINAVLPELAVAGRTQRFRDSHGWVFDVAHNPAAARALAFTLEQQTDVRRIAIVGMLDDKDVEAFADSLRPHVDEWIAVSASARRAIPAPELARRLAAACNTPCLIAESPEQAVAEARARVGAEAEILVLGSFHTVGPIQQVLGL
ncbi:MAG: bifunctional tetrahydrofolate synthase/dihydrofolate synthase [Pseudomonadota bacterium]